MGDVPAYLDRYVDAGCCWVWTGPVHTKYTRRGPVYRAMVHVPGQGTTNAARAMHRAVYGVILGSGWKVRHTCDQAMCVNPAHLIAGTSASNTADAVARARLAPGGVESPERVGDCCQELAVTVRNLPQAVKKLVGPPSTGAASSTVRPQVLHNPR